MACRATPLFLGLLFGLISLADTQQTGTIVGGVVDQTGAVLPGVSVELVDRHVMMAGVTDGAGGFRFEQVPPAPGRTHLSTDQLHDRSSHGLHNSWPADPASIPS